ncbi:MAG: biopolymer transporter ExbD [Opitutae bacterium]
MPKTKLKKPASEGDEPDLTPMIDVIFLLIIFFLIAGRMIQQGRPEITMPVAEAAMKSAKDDIRTEFTVDEAGNLYHLDTPIGSSFDTAKMQDIIEKKRSLPGGEKLKVYLRADAKATYGDVKRVMAACAAKGQTKILFASYVKDN